MLTQQSQGRKCLLNSKMEVYILSKESDPIRESDQEMKGAEQLQVKRLQNILAPNGACQERSVDL